MTIDRTRGRATNQSTPVEKMWDRIMGVQTSSNHNQPSRKPPGMEGKCMRCGKPQHQPGQKCAAKNAKCKECHKIGHFHKICQSKKRGRRAHLAQIAPPQSDQDTHIDENGVRQPNPPMVNMLKIVNHIEATKGSQKKHLKFPTEVPRGPYKHHLVVRVDTGADVNCMDERNFFLKINSLYVPMRYRTLELSCRHFYTGTVLHLLAVQGRKVFEHFYCHQCQQLPQSTQPLSNFQDGCSTS